MLQKQSGQTSSGFLAHKRLAARYWHYLYFYATVALQLVLNRLIAKQSLYHTERCDPFAGKRPCVICSCFAPVVQGKGCLAGRRVTFSLGLRCFLSRSTSFHNSLYPVPMYLTAGPHWQTMGEHSPGLDPCYKSVVHLRYLLLPALARREEKTSRSCLTLLGPMGARRAARDWLHVHWMSALLSRPTP